MSSDRLRAKLLTVIPLALWIVVILLPLLILFIDAVSSAKELEVPNHILASALRSFALAAGIAGVAVILGWTPGRLLGTSRSGKDLLLLLVLMPLVLPRYVLYYAWTLLLSPTTKLGAYLSSRPDIARCVGTLTSSAVLVLWYWSLAALLIAQGWRNMNSKIWDCASLEAGWLQRFTKITLPLLARPLFLAFAICFVLSLSEFATFHLAGIETIGTELAVAYELTGSPGLVARAAWPVLAAALIVAIAVAGNSSSWTPGTGAPDSEQSIAQTCRWLVLLALTLISWVVPVALLIGSVTGTQALEQFFRLHQDELGWSLAIAAVAAVIAHLIAWCALSLDRTSGCDAVNVRLGRGAYLRLLCLAVRSTIFLAMFVPACLVAVALVRMLAVCNAPMTLRQSWYLVSAGQAGRFAGVAMILLLLTRYPDERYLSEMASLDGASRLKAWWHVHLPHTWPVVIGSFIIVLVFSITELSATMVLLPAGLPNFAQRLLNQMHYARDQQVIASCLVLICLFLVLTAAVVLLLRVMRIRRQIVFVFFAVFALAFAGCDGRPRSSGQPKVLGHFGRTGAGPGEFLYPRAIDTGADGSIFVVDKTGRIQRLAPKGGFLDVIKMPLIEAGKPTGLSIAPNGNLYVADTHYHRVVVFSPEGKLVDEFGQFGQEDGCFIYPTDVAFAPDGRIFVSEYGGNDRISVFDEKHGFLFSFGSPGDAHDQFSRPSALCVDRRRGRLYVGDACNHRIAIYSLDGRLLDLIGSPGLAPGQLRYPYDLALLQDGTLLVCEYGNNRLQLFSPDGKSLAVYGRPGRQLGELAYPWGVAVDTRRRVLVVDAGNNRIQVWQL